MKNITLALDEETHRAGREYARHHHTSLNALIRKLLRQTIAQDSKTSGLEEFLRLAEAAKADSKGWKWNREEIHDRKGLR